MIIYIIPNSGKSTYIVPDSVTRDQGISLSLPNSEWILGTETDANNLLQSVQQEVLNNYKVIFSVCKSIRTSEGHQQWSVCDITQEEPNTDVYYHIFNPMSVEHIDVVGLDAAIQTLTGCQNEVLQHLSLDKPTVLTELPAPYVASKEVSQGTQTI